MGALVSPSVHAQSSEYDRYRDQEKSFVITIETKLPYDSMKKCILTKAYAIGNGTYLPAKDPNIFELKSPYGKAETYEWGYSIGSLSFPKGLIDFITTERGSKAVFYGQIRHSAKLADGKRQLPLQFFSYFSECTGGLNTSQESITTSVNTAAHVGEALYKLDSVASAEFMADCLIYNASTYSRTRLNLKYPVYANITRGIDGYYTADYKNSIHYKKEKLFIDSNGTGSVVGWTSTDKKTLKKHKKNFNREEFEKNHTIISDLKICDDIASGKTPPITDFPIAKPDPLSKPRKTALEVFEPIIANAEKQYADGETEMAEMPLETLAVIQPTANVKIDDIWKKKNGGYLPVKYIGAAKLINPSTQKDRPSTLPLVYIHPRDGSRQKDKIAILADTANHLYCDEAAGSKLRNIYFVPCYQDKDQDGIFETQRLANVKRNKSVANIYFVTEAKPITPKPYRKMMVTEIPETTIQYRVSLYSGSVNYCPYYQGEYNKQSAFFCYLSLIPNQPVATNGVTQFSMNEFSMRVTVPLTKKSIVTSAASFEPGTLIGRVIGREPLFKFGTQPLWIDRFVKGREYLALQNQQFEPYQLKGQLTLSGNPEQLVASTYREPKLHIEVSQVIETGSGNVVGASAGQSLIGYSLSFDKQTFEPARLLACGVEQAVASTSANATFCFVADRPQSSIYFRFPTHLDNIGNRYTVAARGALSSIKPASSAADTVWIKRLYFDSWSTNELGQDIALFTSDIFYGDRPVTSLKQYVNIARSNKFEVLDTTYKIRKTESGGYELYDGVEKKDEDAG